LSAIFAWRTRSVEDDEVSASTLSWAVFCWSLAFPSVASALASWRLRSTGEAEARAWPAFTRSPTATLTSPTVQVVELPPEPLEDELASELARWGLDPNWSP